jgi:hypothetical protein
VDKTREALFGGKARGKRKQRQRRKRKEKERRGEKRNIIS